MIRGWIALAILIGAVGACGPFCGNGKLNLSNGKLNPTSFTCPLNATDYGYSIKGTFEADNQSNKDITIKSMSTTVTVVKLAGSNWSMSVGDKSGADATTSQRRGAAPTPATTQPTPTPTSRSCSRW